MRANTKRSVEENFAVGHIEQNPACIQIEIPQVSQEPGQEERISQYLTSLWEFLQGEQKKAGDMLDRGEITVDVFETRSIAIGKLWESRTMDAIKKYGADIVWKAINENPNT